MRIAAVAIAIALAGASCGSGSDGATSADGAGPDSTEALADSAQPVSGGKLRYCVESDVSGFNPYLDRWSAGGTEMASSVYDQLAVFDESGDVVPFLAKSFEPNDDFTKWKILVREGVTFSDGTAFDSSAIVAHMGHLQESFLTRAAITAVDTVTAVDPMTVEVTMKQPWASFPVVFTTQAGFVAAPNADPTQLSSTPVGTGPFQFARRETTGLAVVKNPDYWRKGLPYLDGVDFVYASSGDGCESKLINDEVDAAQLSQSLQIEQVRSSGKGFHVEEDRGEQEELFVMLNASKAPFDDVRMRRALSYATDPAAFIEATGEGTVATGLFAPGSKWFTGVAPTGFDLDQATQLVTELKADRKPTDVVLTGLDDSVNLERAQVLATQWNAAGISVTFDTVDQNALVVAGLAGQYQAVIWRQFGSPDPDGDYVWWAQPVEGETSLNFARFDDPAMESALQDGRRTDIEEARRDAYARVEKRMADGVPYVWLSRVNWVVASTDEVHDVRNVSLPDGAPALPFLNGVHRLAETWIAPTPQ